MKQEPPGWHNPIRPSVCTPQRSGARRADSLHSRSSDKSHSGTESPLPRRACRRSHSRRGAGTTTWHRARLSNPRTASGTRRGSTRSKSSCRSSSSTGNSPGAQTSCLFYWRRQRPIACGAAPPSRRSRTPLARGCNCWLLAHSPGPRWRRAPVPGGTGAVSRRTAGSTGSRCPSWCPSVVFCTVCPSNWRRSTKGAASSKAITLLCWPSCSSRPSALPSVFTLTLPLFLLPTLLVFNSSVTLLSHVRVRSIIASKAA
mmetsp:Transcript_53144/g.92729  ORF Transcript_53144/g.92729 Transcript_53144/m.92729 type:complete len:258 (-) Transcript_53144:634-1407(-)